MVLPIYLSMFSFDRLSGDHSKCRYPFRNSNGCSVHPDPNEENWMPSDATQLKILTAFDIMFCPKYRYRILKDMIAEYVRQSVDQLCQHKERMGVLDLTPSNRPLS